MTGSVERQEWRWVLIIALLVVGIAALPYLVAWLITPAGKVYTGLLVNPLDGHSYLAKMRQGAAGQWLFTLPFTSEPQRGAFVYEYYLFLGHFSSLSGLPLIVTYHIARSLAGLFLLVVIYRFVAEFIAEVNQRRITFLIVALSSGLGWILAASGTVGVDLWVPEANTFYSTFVNPHFPVAEALILLTFLGVAAPLNVVGDFRPGWTAFASRRKAIRLLLSSGSSLALAFVQPFALLVVYSVLGAFLVCRSLTQRRWFSAAWARAIIAGLVSAPLMLYFVSVFASDPVFAAWSSQNVTPTPPFWQVLAGYGILVPLAIAGGVRCFRQRQGLFLVLWVGLNLALLYAPFALQRRLLLGFHIPVAVLAALGLVKVVWPPVGSRRFLVSSAVLLLLVPSTLFVMLVPVLGSAQSQWPLHITEGEKAALNWLRDSTQRNTIVLASPEMGLIIPARTGNRVVYGHPFETIDAEEKKAEVKGFFEGEIAPDDLLAGYDIRYIFVGPHDKTLGGFKAEAIGADFAFDIPYSNAEVTIYQMSAPNGGES